MYARNVASFLAYMVKDGKVQLNLQDEIIRETLVTRGGEIVNPRGAGVFSNCPRPATVIGYRRREIKGAIMPADFISDLYVFILAGLRRVLD